jgi:hypothetical protein
MAINTLAGRTYNDLNQYPVSAAWGSTAKLRLTAVHEAHVQSSL